MPDTDLDPELFLDALAHELRLRGCHVLRIELRQWLRDCWPLVEGDPSPGRWASAYQEQQTVRVAPQSPDPMPSSHCIRCLAPAVRTRATTGGCAPPAIAVRASVSAVARRPGRRWWRPGKRCRPGPRPGGAGGRGQSET